MDGSHPPPPTARPKDDDVSLIRCMLSLGVRDRLAVLQAQASSLARLRDAASGR